MCSLPGIPYALSSSDIPDGHRLLVHSCEDCACPVSREAAGPVPRAGLPPGPFVRALDVVELPLDGLIDRSDRLRPRSSHALGFREVIGVAEIIRGHPLPGRIIAVGGVRFGLGAGLSPSVRRAVPRMAGAVRAAVAELRA